MFGARLMVPSGTLKTFPTEDLVASDILDMYTDEPGVPRITTGNGDCLFNAMSVLLCGHEGLSRELRYHTRPNMVRKERNYPGWRKVTIVHA
ncbi:hypothetical protein DPMN_024932 [Dreissena polymorpha]|uniref:OTU domain-containing protein n=1 Tax=Dreissena polymorpha TaxID=45954 RepID=A0A9D4LQB4_DREPO|nr:hypothetical protein DPMN_024932 [Dreissena polymorpha]